MTHLAVGTGDGPADVDPRAGLLPMTHKIAFADIPAQEQAVVLAVARAAYERFILYPTRSAWRKDNKEDPAWSRRMLERDLERTSLREMAQYIKKELDAQLGPLWHVAYGRGFAAYVTYETMSFLHFTIDGADCIVWRHGK